MEWPDADHAFVPRRKTPKPPPTPFGDVSEAILDFEIPISNEWKRQVTQRLKEMGQGLKELGQHIGCSQSNLTNTLSIGAKRKQKASSFAHAIALATGVGLPAESLGALVNNVGSARNPEAYRELFRGLALSLGIRLT